MGSIMCHVHFCISGVHLWHSHGMAAFLLSWNGFIPTLMEWLHSYNKGLYFSLGIVEWPAAVHLLAHHGFCYGKPVWESWTRSCF